MENPRPPSNLSRKKSYNILRVAPSKALRNPFLNFMRDFRKSNKQKLNLTEMTKRGAQIWRSMSQREKSPYLQLSRQAPKKSIRRKKKSKRKKSRSRKSKKRRGKSSRRRRRHHDRFSDTDSDWNDEVLVDPKSKFYSGHKKRLEFSNERDPDDKIKKSGTGNDSKISSTFRSENNKPKIDDPNFDSTVRKDDRRDH